MIALYISLFILILIALAFLLLPLQRQTSKGWLLPAVIIIIMPIFVVFLYQHLGDYQGVLKAQTLKQQKSKEALLKQYKSPQQLIAKMETILHQHPDSGRGWYLLGRLYFTQGNLIKAIDALHQAKRLQPMDEKINIQLAHALYFAHDMHLNQEARMSIETVIRQYPYNVSAHNLLAIAAYKDGNYVEALNQWQIVLRHLPAGSQDKTVVTKAIAITRAKLSQQTTGIRIKVSLDKALQNHFSMQLPVFIYARATHGSKIPIAIKRVQLKDLPCEVTLSDSDSIIDNPMVNVSNTSKKLGEYQQVTLIARVGHRGNAMAEKGDVYGKVEHFKLLKNKIVTKKIKIAQYYGK